MINQLINGLVYGGLLVILSSGLVLIFGLRQVVNFAHGAFYTLGAYVALSVSAFVGFWGALAAAFVALSVVGVALDRLCFRPLQNRPHAVVLIITFGLFLIVTDLVQLVWGRESYSLLPPPDFTGPVDVFGTPYPVYRLVVLALAVVAAVALLVCPLKSGPL